VVVEHLRVVLGVVLRALVSVCHELHVSAGLAVSERDPQRIEHQVGAHVAGELPADDHPREHVDQEREVHAPFPRTQVGEVADPQPIGRGRGELAVDEIRALLRGRIGDRRPPQLPAALAPLMPSGRITRATWSRPTCSPWRCSSCHTRGYPEHSKFCSCTSRIRAISRSSSTLRAERAPEAR